MNKTLGLSMALIKFFSLQNIIYIYEEFTLKKNSYSIFTLVCVM